MCKKYIKFIGLFFLANLLVFGEKIDKKELDHLRAIGVLSQENYNILLGNKGTGLEKCVYSLTINGQIKTDVFNMINENKRLYIPIKEFFKNISFTNYKLSKDSMTILLGDNLKKININFLNNTISVEGKDSLIKLNKESYIKKNGDIYLRENIFKELFLSFLRVDKNTYKMNMTLSFSSPEDIDVHLERVQDILKNKKLFHELYFTNKPELFEVGYLRVQADQIFRKGNSSKDKYKSDWDGNLEYQGAGLYGNFTTNYDIKNNLFGDTTVRYNDIWEKHTLEIGSYTSGYGKSREWGLSFKKEKGYIIESGKTYIIKENVPIGSRVELLYMGMPIAVQNSENGVVRFVNSEIKGDRDYILKIYEPSGKIEERSISTASDYNQQNKGQLEYDINLREDENSSKLRSYSNVYYGVTNNLTMGFGYIMEPQSINDNYVYLHTGRLEGVYSNNLYNYPYTLVVGGEKVFSNVNHDNTGKNLDEKYSYDTLGQIDIKNIRLKIKDKRSGSYYDERDRQDYSIKYTPLKSLDFHYDYTRVENHYNNHKSDSIFTANYSRTIKDLLVSTEYSTNRTGKDSYGVNLYYNGFRAFTTRLENRWDNDGKDYSTTFSIFNGGDTNLNYTLEASYSEKTKDMFTFRFSLQYDNLLNFDFTGNKDGSREFKFGIDRVIDLKKPLKNIDSMDSSRVKVVTFIDTNDNNILDKGEKPVNNVVVTIGGQKVTTNVQGVGMLYGIPNYITYNLKPIIRKPSFLLGNNKIVVEGRCSSTLIAYIPVKPMVTLTGIVKIDDTFKKKAIDKMEVYSNLLVTIKDTEGNMIETTMPDETGIFEVSGLFPKKYYIQVTYVGMDRTIKGIDRPIQMTYVNSEEDDNIVNFNVNKDFITMEEGDENQWVS